MSFRTNLKVLLCFCLFSLIESSGAAETVRLKDIGRFEGLRDNYLVGYGLVTGLAGTGDSARNRATRQSLANLLNAFEVAVPADQINSRNVAVVSILATLPAVVRPGDKVDIVVSSIGDAKSLMGGALLLAPLKGPDGKVYALAQGAISTGAYRFDMSANVEQKNHPTVGRIPGGAQIEERLVAVPIKSNGAFDFILTSPDYTTAQRIASAINHSYRSDIAQVKDSGSIEVRSPSSVVTDHEASFLSVIENLEVTPDMRARIVINERTGIIVAGGDVSIAKATIVQGDIKISIQTDYVVYQPTRVIRPSNGIRTETVPDTQVNVDEGRTSVLDFRSRTTIADLVNGLKRFHASTRDVISALQALKTAGAINAEIILQ